MGEILSATCVVNGSPTLFGSDSSGSSGPDKIGNQEAHDMMESINSFHHRVEGERLRHHIKKCCDANYYVNGNLTK